jgi:hypothetical protein
MPSVLVKSGAAKHKLGNNKQIPNKRFISISSNKHSRPRILLARHTKELHRGHDTDDCAWL